jgi:hypothetical protein
LVAIDDVWFEPAPSINIPSQVEEQTCITYGSYSKFTTQGRPLDLSFYCAVRPAVGLSQPGLNAHVKRPVTDMGLPY